MTMSLRRLVVVAIAFVVGISIVRVLATSQWKSRINRDGFDRIEVGMSPSEVETVLGATPGDYTVVKNALAYYLTFCSFRPPRDAESLPWEKQQWISDEGAIAVTFDCNGRVLYKSFDDMDEYPKRTALEVVERLQRKLIP